MSFFDSDFVQQEIQEIVDLQEKIYENVFRFPTMTKEEKLNHIGVLQKLLQKQKVLYTRLSLSDDPEAKRIKSRIMESASLMGLSKNMDMNVIFNNMNELIEKMKKQFDNTKENL